VRHVGDQDRRFSTTHWPMNPSPVRIRSGSRWWRCSHSSRAGAAARRRSDPSDRSRPGARRPAARAPRAAACPP
jgi:hypothetical protein